MKRSRPFACAVLSGALVPLLACPALATTKKTTKTTKPATGPKALRIGFIPPTMGIPAFQGLAQGLQGAGKQFGDKLLTAEAKGDPVVQLQTIQQWVKLKQIDALWVIPTAAKTIAPALTDATSRGIVVVAGGKAADYGFSGAQKGITFSDIDNTAFGKGIGELMAKCVSSRLGGNAKVLYVGPSSANESTTNINASSEAALAAGAKGATIVQKLIAKADQASTQQMIASAVQGNPDTNAFMAGDAESTMAGLNAYLAAGKAADKTCIVGNGGTDDQKAAIKDGKLFGVVAFDFVGDLVQNLTELHSMSAKAPGKQLTVPISVIAG